MRDSKYQWPLDCLPDMAPMNVERWSFLWPYQMARVRHSSQMNVTLGWGWEWMYQGFGSGGFATAELARANAWLHLPKPPTKDITELGAYPTK